MRFSEDEPIKKIAYPLQYKITGTVKMESNA